jgi:four helix bundle protein
MDKALNPKRYDLEERTLEFAKCILKFIKPLPKTIANIEITKQLIRSSGSIGANYIEANESLSKKDFAMRIKICRKESKETIYWLKLLEVNNEDNKKNCATLIEEASQLTKIFSSIAEKSK